MSKTTLSAYIGIISSISRELYPEKPVKTPKPKRSKREIYGYTKKQGKPKRNKKKRGY